MRIALIGTRGVPARYGGFETCVEEVGARLVVAGHQVVVFCRPESGTEPMSSYRGMDLVALPALRRRSLETLSHTTRSVLHRALSGADAAIVFNSANAPLLPVLRARRIPVATHVDGLEWQRAKWGPLGSRYYRIAEALAVRWSDALIADATGIADYYRQEFGASTRLISYGAPIIAEPDQDRLVEVGLESGDYHLVVARFEPENHLREIVAGYVRSRATSPLVVVGSAPYAEAYTAEVRRQSDGRVRFLGALWDQQLLDQLYAGATSYLHGHSVGGTNPSLLRAAGAGAYTIAYDVAFNREVLGNDGDYFTDEGSLASLLDRAEESRAEAAERGRRLRAAIARYDWDDVGARYEQLCSDLATGALDRVKGSNGRRLRPAARRRSEDPAIGQATPAGTVSTFAKPLVRSRRGAERDDSRAS